ncbi:glycosyltransferase [Francisella salina]|uniref:Glycosyltransferase protein n=1 Tax=Francisella salina TaxID=573569 RepID=A0ABM5M8Y7_FRAST|nr:glycosyltransferase [Francisella salina]AEI35689.1 putative glycosyltransferase protein [Francisella salina]
MKNIIQANELLKSKKHIDAYRLYMLNVPEDLRHCFKYNVESCIDGMSYEELEQVEKKMLNKPPKNLVIRRASEIMNAGFVRHGIEYAKRYCSDEERSAIELLKANRALTVDNEDDWLKYLNTYLAYLGASPLELNKTGVNRFLRIDSSIGDLKKVYKEPLVSILMPVFNAEEYIEHSVYSLLNQTWVNIEIIAIDDCSSDSSLEILRNIAQKDSRLRILSNKSNVGPYVSKNYALGIAKGKYITGHDADDWAHPQRIEKQVLFMEVNSNVKASIGKMIRVNTNGIVEDFAKVSHLVKDGGLRTAFVSCIFESSFLKEELGAWDSVRFAADSEIMARATALLGDSLVYTDIFCMICINLETGLTNCKTNGIRSGLSESRKVYKANFLKWHEELRVKGTYRLDFPLKKRPFEAHQNALVSIANVFSNLRKKILYLTVSGQNPNDPLSMAQIADGKYKIDRCFFYENDLGLKPNSTFRLNVTNYQALELLRDRYDIEYISVRGACKDIDYNCYDVVIINTNASPRAVGDFIKSFHEDSFKSKVVFGTEFTWIAAFKKGLISDREMRIAYRDNLLLRHTHKTDRHVYSDDSFMNTNIREFEIGLDTNIFKSTTNIGNRRYITFVAGPEGRVTKNNDAIYEIAAEIEKVASDYNLEVRILKPPYAPQDFWNIMGETLFFVFTSNGETFSYVLNDAKSLGAITFYPSHLYYTDVDNRYVIESYPRSGIKYDSSDDLIVQMTSLLKDEKLLQDASEQSRSFVVDNFSVDKIRDNFISIIEGTYESVHMLFVIGEVSRDKILEIKKKYNISVVVSYLNELGTFDNSNKFTIYDRENDIVYLRYYLDQINGEKYLSICKQPYIHAVKGYKKFKEENIKSLGYLHAWCRSQKITDMYIYGNYKDNSTLRYVFDEISKRISVYEI